MRFIKPDGILVRRAVARLHRGRGMVLGESTRVSPRTFIREPHRISIGDRTVIGHHVELVPQDGHVTIGADCTVQALCVIYGAGGVDIGDGCRIAHGTKIIAFNHNFGDPAIPIRTQGTTREPIVIEDDVWLGVNAVVLAGVRIGRGSVIGAGAVVTRDIPAYSIAVGNPARVVRSRLEMD
jgi:acetyltransferase-like isoleucine patch superfamily enzyme